MADADRVRLSYVNEVTYGTTPSAALTDLRFTGESLSLETDTVMSGEIRSDRQPGQVRRTNINASGALDFELSYDTFDGFIRAGIQGAAWTSVVAVTHSTVSVATADDSFNDSGAGFVSDGYVANQWIKTSGFTDAANNGYFKIVSVTTAKIVVEGANLVDEGAAGGRVLTQGPYITNGVTEQFFSIEKHFTDLTNKFEIYKGLMVDSMNLSTSPDSILTGSLDFVGQSVASAASTAGSSYVSANSNEVMNAVDNVVSVYEGGSTYASTGFDFSVANNLRQRSEIGSLGPQSIGSGTIDITGTVNAYFADSTVMDKYLNFTATSLAMIVKDSSNNAYVFDFPSVHYTSGTRSAGGKDSDIIAEMAWQANRDTSEGVTCRIAKFAAVA